jgi:hypothetical protein
MDTIHRAWTEYINKKKLGFGYSLTLPTHHE